MFRLCNSGDAAALEMLLSSASPDDARAAVTSEVEEKVSGVCRQLSGPVAVATQGERTVTKARDIRRADG